MLRSTTGVLKDILERLGAPGGYQAFASQVKATRCCRRPVRLVGHVAQFDDQGKRTMLLDTEALADGVLLKACGTRRETLCPPCASVYRGDAYQLVAAGLRGRKGIPEVVAGHPAVFLTLTAPSFGVVHRQGTDGGCHLGGRRCPHGVALVCARRHAEGDDALGQALCAACYDYEGAVLWKATVSELWRRTTIYVLRELGHLAGMSVRQAARTLRLSYVKVIEFQQRGSVHLHALLRVDVKGDELGPGPFGIDGDMLEAAVRIAAAKVSAPLACSVSGRVAWGAQLDVAALQKDVERRDRAVAYMAKYACKGSDRNGALDRRLRAGVPTGMRLPAHLRRMAEAAWELGGEAELETLRLRLWAHTCGHRGHFLTKSQRYSTTFGWLRSERAAWEAAPA
ncbi:MAG: replication initiator [Nitrososphaerales archaeon]